MAFSEVPTSGVSLDKFSVIFPLTCLLRRSTCFLTSTNSFSMLTQLPPMPKDSPPASTKPPPVLTNSPPMTNDSPDSPPMSSNTSSTVISKVTAKCMNFITETGRVLRQWTSPYATHLMIRAVFFPAFSLDFPLNELYRFMIYEAAGLDPIEARADDDDEPWEPRFDLKSLQDDVTSLCRQTQRDALLTFILCVAVYCFGDTVATYFGYHLLVLVAVLYSVQGFCLSYLLKTFVQSVTSDVIDRWTQAPRQIEMASMLLAAPDVYRPVYLFLAGGVIMFPYLNPDASTVPFPDSGTTSGETLSLAKTQIIFVMFKWSSLKMPLNCPSCCRPWTSSVLAKNSQTPAQVSAMIPYRSPSLIPPTS
ncbi:hypothetical protein BC629DRAFT_442186 [Irpex lacteus]|nr:hypothetical protein BC629DRAFT_442186 [Irpex lacteus]